MEILKCDCIPSELLMLGRPKRDIALIRKIKEWAYECLPISADAAVSVMELECREEGCPPQETVIAAMEKGKETLQWKFHKAMPEVTHADVARAASEAPPSCS